MDLRVRVVKDNHHPEARIAPDGGLFRLKRGIWADIDGYEGKAPNNVHTKSMSVFARENLFEFDKFVYGSAASTLLFIILALLTMLVLWLGRVRLDRGLLIMWDY